MEKPDIRIYPVKGYEGEWVFVKGNKVIAHDPDMKKILRIAEKYPDNERYVITRIFSANASFY